MSKQNEINSLSDAGLLWIKKVEFRAKNIKSLQYSGKIALRIMAAMEDIPDMNPLKLSDLTGYTLQYVKKILRGHANMNLETIAKFSEALSVDLISFPAFKYNNEEFQKNILK